jgi:hypothetical protein
VRIVIEPGRVDRAVAPLTIVVTDDGIGGAGPPRGTGSSASSIVSRRSTAG